MQAQTYAQAYATLKAIAEGLRNGGPADIDTLVERFREARDAHAFCRDRIEAIRQEIEAEIDRTGGKALPETDPFAE